MRRALVTGASGFVGQWLCRALVRDGWAVTGVSLSDLPAVSCLSAEDRARVQWLRADLLEAGTMTAALHASRPHAIFHLAGVAYVPAFADQPLVGFRTNVDTTVVMLEAVRAMRDRDGLDPTMLVVGSAEEYGRLHATDGPVAETRPCTPITWYAASKVAQEVMALGAFRADALRVVATRSFNQAGPGQSKHFVLPSLVQRIVALRMAGNGPHELLLGNLDTVRDFLHVADAVDAYVALVAHGVPGEVYNVCSGAGVSVEALAREVCERAGIAAELVSDPTLRRPVDVPWLVGDNTKLRTTTGWMPRRSRSDIIDDLLNAPSL